jgi:hypothetical protein
MLSSFAFSEQTPFVWDILFLLYMARFNLLFFFRIFNISILMFLVLYKDNTNLIKGAGKYLFFSFVEVTGQS